MCATRNQKQFTCTLVKWAAIIPGASPNLCQSAGLQESYIHEKLDLHIISWFWRGSLRQQKPSASNLVFLSTQVNLYFVGINCVLRSMAVHLNIRSQLVTNYSFFQNSTVVLLDFQPQSDPLWWSATLQGRMSDIRCLTINLCFGPSYLLTKFEHGVFLHLYTST
jgi:hypothetical protein